MQVSRLPVFIFLIILGGFIMVFSPVIAGEHPWDDDRNSGGGTTSDSTLTEPGDPGDDTPGGGDLFGTIIYWWRFVFEQPYVDGGKNDRDKPSEKMYGRGGTHNTSAAQ